MGAKVVKLGSWDQLLVITWHALCHTSKHSFLLFSFHKFIEIPRNVIITNKLCSRTLAGKTMPLSLKLKLLKHRHLSAYLALTFSISLNEFF